MKYIFTYLSFIFMSLTYSQTSNDTLLVEIASQLATNNKFITELNASINKQNKIHIYFQYPNSYFSPDYFLNISLNKDLTIHIWPSDMIFINEIIKWVELSELKTGKHIVQCNFKLIKLNQEEHTIITTNGEVIYNKVKKKIKKLKYD